MQRGSNSSNNNRMLVHPACASCKHQRKRCTENCALAPYFPAEKTLEFQAVHKVFGVSNVVKLVKDVIAERRKETVDSLVWEALCRQNDPILGCYGKLKRLQEEFDLYKTQHTSLNQNQLGQHHGSVVYSSNKETPTMVNRTNNRGNNGIGGGLASNNMVSYDTEKLIFDSIQHSYHCNYVQSTLDKSKQERDAGSLLLLPSPPPPPFPQHHSFNGFNQQQYYLPGEFGSMDSTLFIGSEEDGL